jgi:hypothetical protein
MWEVSCAASLRVGVIMSLKRRPQQPMYRAINAATGEVLLRWRAKNLVQARAMARAYLFLFTRDGGIYDIQRYESNVVGWVTK